MSDVNRSRITEPLRELAIGSPAECFSVVVRVVVVADDPSTAYSGVSSTLQLVEKTISGLTLDAAKHEGVTASGAQAGSPFLYATLTGANVLALDEQDSRWRAA